MLNTTRSMMGSTGWHFSKYIFDRKATFSGGGIVERVSSSILATMVAY